MTNCFKILVYCFILFFGFNGYGQDLNFVDSLSKKTYDELEKNITHTINDSIKNKYVEYYIKKAKSEKERLKVNQGYNYLMDMNSHTYKGVKYADSILQISKETKDDNIIADAYLKKGIQLFYVAENKEALNNYLLANDFALKNNDVFLKLKIKHYMASLKNAVNEEKEALKMFKENLSFFKNPDNKVKYRKQYLKSLFSLSNAYNRNDMPDSSLVLVEVGIAESLKSPDKYLYPFFVLSYGATKKLKKEYSIAIDSFLKGASLLKNQKNELCDSYLLLSKTYALNNEKIKSIEYLNKIDSIYNKHSQVVSRARKANELLAKYYQETNNVSNQLKRVKKLLEIDSILEIKDINLSKRIVKEYDTPLLISEKERLIAELNENNLISKNRIIIMLIVISILVILFVTIVFRSKANKKKYEAVLNNISTVDSIVNNKDTNIATANNNGLSEELTKEILLALEKFEDSKKFIEHKYTLNTLAKELNTNSTYLSKVINVTKKVNFANYLNNLKVEYALEKLSNDKQFRSYTIKAIAKDSGFNNAQSFSVAFNKKTGIYPSYFIKRLNDDNKNK